MCPDKNHISTYQSQRGFLLPLALFILVVMGVLALTISRTSTQTQTSSIQELTNIQAFYAAESGAQRGMQRLFLSTTSRRLTDQTCADMAINHNFSGVNGLEICTATVECVCVYQNGSQCVHEEGENYFHTSLVNGTKSFYTLESKGACGQNQYRAERIIEVSAYREQE